MRTDKIFYYMLLLSILLLSPVFSLQKQTKHTKQSKQKKHTAYVKLVKPKPPKPKLRQAPEGCGYTACANTNGNSLNVHIVPATHAELGHTKTFSQHFLGMDKSNATLSDVNMKAIYDAVITELSADNARKFTISDVIYFYHWYTHTIPKVRRKVQILVREGRLSFVGGGWGMSDESVANYHAIIDMYTFTLRKLEDTFHKCGRPLVTWQVDSFGHSREFASLMAQMGFDGHFISPISFDEESARMRSKSLEFVWRGSDDLGSDAEIFTHKLFDGYWSPPGFSFGDFSSDPLIRTEADISNVDERVSAFIELMLQRQRPYYTTNNVMVVMGHRFGYHDAKTWFDNIDKLIKFVNLRETTDSMKLNLFYSTPACYLKAVQKEKPELKSKQDDFFPLAYDENSLATGMYTSRPAIKYMAKEIHLLIQIAKQLQIFARMGMDSAKFEPIQWIAGAINDHTILAGAMRQHVYNYYVNKVHVAKELWMEMYQPAFNILRNAPRNTTYQMCRFNISSCWTISGDTSFIVVYNPLAWHVTLPIRLPVHRQQYSLFDPHGNVVHHSIISLPKLVQYIPERLESSQLPNLKDELVFLAEKLPPMGFRSYFLEKLKNREKRSVVKLLTKYKSLEEINAKNTSDNRNVIGTIEHPKIEVSNVTQARSTMLLDDNILSSRIKKLNKEEENLSVNKFMGLLKKRRSQLNLKRRRNHTASAMTSKNYDEQTDQPHHIDYNARQHRYRKRERSDYFSTFVMDKFIKNEHITINLDQDKSRITSLVLSYGIKIKFNIQMMYYISDNPKKMGTNKKPPGSYIFRPMTPKPVSISKKPLTDVLKTKLVEEIHIKFAHFAGIAIKLYKSLPYVEVDWVVGPIPVEDGLGKDVFIRYATDLQNNGVFYTDANGRQTIKRKKDFRSFYVPIDNDRVAANFYPVSSRVFIEDTTKNISFVVFPDRGEGCTSLDQGQLDIMLHRRILTDDSGLQCYLNETEFGKGLVVRGTHRLYVSKADFKPDKVLEKKLVKEFQLQPKVFTSSSNHEKVNLTIWQQNTNEYSALTKPMPFGVHILTLEKWPEQKLLIRLENYLEKNDAIHSGIRHIYLKNILKDYKMKRCQETMLAGNLLRDTFVQMKWPKHKDDNFRDFYGNSSKSDSLNDHYKEYRNFEIIKSVELLPQQIRSFLCSYVISKESAMRTIHAVI